MTTLAVPFRNFAKVFNKRNPFERYNKESYLKTALMKLLLLKENYFSSSNSSSSSSSSSSVSSSGGGSSSSSSSSSVSSSGGGGSSSSNGSSSGSGGSSSSSNGSSSGSRTNNSSYLTAFSQYFLSDIPVFKSFIKYTVMQKQHQNFTMAPSTEATIRPCIFSK